MIKEKDKSKTNGGLFYLGVVIFIVFVIGGTHALSASVFLASIIINEGMRECKCRECEKNGEDKRW